MEGKKLPGPLFVAVEEKIIPAAVQQAIGWALVTACAAVASLAFGYAVAYALVHYYGSNGTLESSFVLRCVAMTDAQAAEQRAFWFGWLCCALLQAAVAVMALRIPCRRRALAYLALVVTFVGYCMYAAGLRPFLAADPGFLFGWIVASSARRLSSSSRAVTSSTSWSSSGTGGED